MILKELWLKNFRNHADLHIKLKPGVTAIVGDNGSGKSSIIEAIQFLLTGDLFNHAKREDAIKDYVGSGYAVLTFELNGKRGRIERHLDSSKVVLKYGNEDIIKKSTEVKELWDKLLQLNADIIKKVIIARQGDIPQLFSGDQAIREKVFQRIFLVPPTEKIRSMIWRDYLKQAPPVVPEEDLLQLTNMQHKVTLDLALLEQEIAKCEMYSDDELETIRARITYLRKCRDDAGKNIILEEAAKMKEVVCDELVKKRLVVTRLLEKVDIDDLHRWNATLLQQRGMFLQKLKIENELELIEYPFSKAEFDTYTTLVKENLEKKISIGGEISGCRRAILDMQNELDLIKGLKGKARCPTCKQEIANIEEHITAIEQSITEAKATLEMCQNDFAEVDMSSRNAQRQIDAYNDVLWQEEGFKEQLKQFKDVTFDEVMFKKTNEFIDRHKELKAEKAVLDVQYTKACAELDALHKEIRDLSVYEGDSTVELELVEWAQALEHNTNLVRHYQQLSVDLKVKQAELKSLNERIVNTEANQEKNKLRNKYVATLQKAYDVLHTSQFPRKLIMSYADIVTEHLQENLELFDIPYKARVADNFKIEMYNDACTLPSVSGGQEIIIGISLHLALHDLFSESFPLMIIDEGTTHLDATNRKAYFEMIKGLKAKSRLKQIIIIDHDPQFTDVVDNVIQLEKKQ